MPICISRKKSTWIWPFCLFPITMLDRSPLYAAPGCGPMKPEFTRSGTRLLEILCIWWSIQIQKRATGCMYNLAQFLPIALDVTRILHLKYINLSDRINGSTVRSKDSNHMLHFGRWEYMPRDLKPLKFRLLLTMSLRHFDLTSTCY